jgi:hypothetical protein
MRSFPRQLSEAGEEDQAGDPEKVHSYSVLLYGICFLCCYMEQIVEFRRGVAAGCFRRVVKQQALKLKLKLIALSLFSNRERQRWGLIEAVLDFVRLLLSIGLVTIYG